MLKTNSFSRKFSMVTLLITLFITHVNAQSSGYNYIATYIPRVPITAANTLQSATVANVNQTVQYLDGLGRPVQNVQTKGSPTQRDLVQITAYDQFDREAVKYLPYSDTATSTGYGNYKTTAIAAQSAFYANPTATMWNAPGVVTTNYPTSNRNYESSPLNRPLEQGSPGDNWQLTGTGGALSPGHTVKTVYSCNNATGLTSGTGYWAKHYVVSLNVTYDGHNYTFNPNRLIDSGSYPKNVLYLTVSRNENWLSSQSDTKLNTTQEYKDKFGQVVLKRTFNYNTSTSSREILSTYYIYDEFGRLTFVLPPSANPDSGAVSQRKLDNLCYQYVYDGRGRMVMKKMPGKGWDIMIYNKLNEVIGTQDSVNRMAHPQRVLYTKYDAQGRIITTGNYTITGTSGTNYRSTLQANADAETSYWETKSSSGTYSNVAIPTSNATALIIKYYDDYNISGLPSLYTVISGVTTMTRSMQTASTTAVLNQPADMLWDVMYYDDQGRNVKAFSQTYAGGHSSYGTGNYDLTTTYYNFTNQIDTTIRQHYKGGTKKVGIQLVNTYDHIGRLLTSIQQITGSNGALQAAITLSSKTYNQVGQLYSKGTGSGLQTVNYTYNERGWLTSLTPQVNSSFGGTYAETIAYNNPTGSTTKQYNGSIAQFTYNNPRMNAFYSLSTATTNTVSYTYDNLNRLTQSQSGISATAARSDETISYDLEGNIKSLTRTGQYTGTRIYTYPGQSNQVTTVKYNTSPVRSYTYDGNGNTTADSTLTVAYNILNLPDTVKNSGNINAKYYYDAAGSKLRNIGINSGTVDYINGIVYIGGKISYIQNAEGRNYLSGDSITYTYEYDLKDYLGNVRASFISSSGSLSYVQENDYYPFGLSRLWYSVAPQSNYLYNGKEQQLDLTNKYDFGARFYDALVAKWMSADPDAENSRRWSLYNYGSDNSVLNVDPDGMDGEVYGQSITDLQTIYGSNNVVSYDPSVYFNGQTYAGLNDFFSANQDVASAYDTNTGDFLGLSPYWNDLNKSDLLSIAQKQSGFTGGKLQDYAGKIFEKTFNNFMAGRDPDYSANTNPFDTDVTGRSKVVPDGISSAELDEVDDEGTILASTAIPRTSWYEVKATSSTISASSFGNQSIGLADALFKSNPQAAQEGYSSLTFVTTADARISANFVQQVKANYNINVWQFRAVYRQTDQGIKVSFYDPDHIYVTPWFRYQFWRPYVYLSR